MSTIQVQFIKNSLGTRTIDVDTISVGGPGSITFPSNAITFLRGDNTFTNILADYYRSEKASSAGFRMKDTTLAANAKAWSWETAAAGTIKLLAYDDAYSASNPAISITRVAAVPTLMSLMNAAGTRIVCGNMVDDGATMFQIGGSLYVQGAITHVGAAAFTGTVSLADGTAAIPALSFISDVDIGLYRIGANQIGISVNGALIQSIGQNGALELNNALAAINIFAESGDANQNGRKIFRITDATAHNGNARTGIVLENRVGGSGTAGDASADYGVVVSNFKQSYLSTATIGNVHGGVFLTRQGTGDTIGVITDGAIIAGYGAGRTSKLQQVNAAGTVLKDVRSSTAIIDTVGALFQGQRLQAVVGTLGAAIAIDNVIAVSAWTNLLRSTKDNVVNFNIDVDGKHTFWPVGSASNAINMLNSSGNLLLRANNDTTELLRVMQAGRVVIGGAADDTVNTLQITGTLITTGNGTIGGNAAVTGTSTFTGAATFNAAVGAVVTNAATVGTNLTSGAWRTSGKQIINNNAGNVTLNANTSYLGMTGTQAASVQFTFPAGAAGIDGLIVEVWTAAAVGTAATWVSAGATFVSAPATLAALSTTRFIYHHATTNWLPK